MMLENDAESRQYHDVDFRVPEEPENVLKQDRRIPTGHRRNWSRYLSVSTMITAATTPPA